MHHLSSRSPSVLSKRLPPTVLLTGCLPWQVVSTPPFPLANGPLKAAVAISESDAWAVGYTFSDNVSISLTLIEHWNGVAWEIVPSPNPGSSPQSFGNNALFGIAAVSADDVWAVGFSSPNADNFATGQPLTLHWDGASWQGVSCQNPAGSVFSGLYGVAAVSAQDVWAVGYTSTNPNEESRTLIEHWDGSAWSIVTSPNPQPVSFLNGLAVVSAQDIWAVGASMPTLEGVPPRSTLILHWDGSAWSIVASPNRASESSELVGVVAINANDIWAVGDSYDTDFRYHTLVEHWDGTSWSIVDSPNPGWQNNVLLGVAAISATNVWAAGAYSTTGLIDTGSVLNDATRTLIEHWDGQSWQVVSSQSPGIVSDALFGVAPIPQIEKLWAVGQTGDFTLHLSTLTLFSGPGCPNATSTAT